MCFEHKQFIRGEQKEEMDHVFSVSTYVVSLNFHSNLGRQVVSLSPCFADETAELS